MTFGPQVVLATLQDGLHRGLAVHFVLPPPPFLLIFCLLPLGLGLPSPQVGLPSRQVGLPSRQIDLKDQA